MVFADIVTFYFAGMLVYTMMCCFVGMFMDESSRNAARMALTLPIWPLVVVFLGPYFFIKLIVFVWRTAELPIYKRKVRARKENDF